jgi:hypothetical protein
MVKPNYFKFDQTLDDYLMMPNMLLFWDIQTDLNILYVIGFYIHITFSLNIFRFLYFSKQSIIGPKFAPLILHLHEPPKNNLNR